MDTPTKYKIVYYHHPRKEKKMVLWEDKDPEIFEVYDARDWEVIFNIRKRLFETNRLTSIFNGSRHDPRKHLHAGTAEIRWEFA